MFFHPAISTDKNLLQPTEYLLAVPCAPTFTNITLKLSIIQVKSKVMVFGITVDSNMYGLKEKS
jgi:hypothetical protein